MFAPSHTELLEAGDLFSALLAEGRSLMRTPDAHRSRLEEQQAFVAARAARAAAASMERLQWRPRTSIAMLTVHTCDQCGSQITLFSGFGVEMFRNSDGASRITASPCLDPAYPRQTRYLSAAVTACPQCLTTQGFAL